MEAYIHHVLNEACHDFHLLPCSQLGENRPRDDDVAQRLRKLPRKTSPSRANKAMRGNPGDEMNAVCLPCNIKHTPWAWQDQHRALPGGLETLVFCLDELFSACTQEGLCPHIQSTWRTLENPVVSIPLGNSAETGFSSSSTSLGLPSHRHHGPGALRGATGPGCGLAPVGPGTGWRKPS